MRLLIITERPDDPATRYRVELYRGPLAERGVSMMTMPLDGSDREAVLSEAQRVDAVVIQRCLPATSFLRELRRVAKRLSFDFDDAVSMRPVSNGTGAKQSLKRWWRFRRMIRMADAVTAGNHYLCQLAQRYTGSSAIHLLPTVVDVAKYGEPATPRDSANAHIICWIGQRSTQVYLQTLASVLRALTQSYPNLVLRCITDKSPQLDGVAVELRNWSADTEVAEMKACDVGLAPLTDDPWTRGKCGLRLLQYMAAGVPAVASPVSAQGEIVNAGGALGATTHEQWLAAVHSLIDNARLKRELAQRARELVQTRYVPMATINVVHAAWCGRHT